MLRTIRPGTRRGKRLLVAGLALALLLGFGLAVAQSAQQALALENEGLAAEVTGTYDILLDEPAIDVSWRIDMENTGPASWQEPGDPATVFDSVDVFINGDQSSFAATGPGGRLSAVVEDLGSGFALATVQLGRTLEYGDTYSFNYSYRIMPTADDPYSLRSSYVSVFAYSGVFAIDTYRSSTLIVKVPVTYAQHTLIGEGDCSRSYQGAKAVFECRPEDGSDIATEIEIAKPGVRGVTSRTIASGSGDVHLALTHFVEDQAWADHVVETATMAIPQLEEATGVPYPGPPDLRISERSRQELYGYAGLAGCYETSCGIGISPASDDQTLLHELAHIWTRAFRDRWLLEGTAEFLSIKAAERLGITVSPPIGHGEAPPFALETWGNGIDFIRASEEAKAREYAGYDWSTIFFQRLEERRGSETVRGAYAAVMLRGGGSVDSKDYMDALEDTSGENDDDLFQALVFTEKAVPLLAARRDARDRLGRLVAISASEAPELSQRPLAPIRDAITGWEFEKAQAALGSLEPGLEAYLKIRDGLAGVRAAAAAAGLAYPLPYENALGTWDFSPYIGEVDDAYPAIEAYTAARETVVAPRSLWQELGLFGKSPRAQLNESAAAFAWADFERSIAKSHAAEATVDGAARDALKHVLIAAGALAAAAALSVPLLRWALRDAPAPAGTGSDA